MTIPNAALSGTFAIGGDMTVNRLGFGAMRVTGDGIWGAPRDPAEAMAQVMPPWAETVCERVGKILVITAVL